MLTGVQSKGPLVVDNERKSIRYYTPSIACRGIRDPTGVTPPELLNAGDRTMAKGQLRSNKEPKKPKKAKAPAGAVSPFAATTGAGAAGANRAKKK